MELAKRASVGKDHLNEVFTVANASNNDVESKEYQHGGSGFGKFKQVLIILITSIWFMNMAIFLAFSNAAESDIRRHGKTFFDGQITLSSTELDMLSSLIYVGAIPGSLLWGWLTGTLGRRPSMMLLVLPSSLGWCITGLAVNPVMLLTGRLIHGIAYGGTSVVCNTYIAEIGEKSIRGKLIIVTQISIALGFFISVTLAISLHFYQFAYLGITLSILAFILTIFIPESPLFLIINDELIKAKKILLSLQGSNLNVEKEILNLKNENNSLMKQSFLEILKQPSVLKSLFVVTNVFLIQNMCGLYVYYLNAVRIIADATRNTSGAIDERYAVVFSFMCQLSGTALALAYIDRIGRRKSIIMSLLLVAIFNFILGSYNMIWNDNNSVVDFVSWNSNTTLTRDSIRNLENETKSITDTISKESSPLFWIPLVCLMGTMFSASLGIEPVPWILNTEYFPTCIRSEANSICTVFANIFAITVLQLYSPMQSALGSAGLYYFYGSCSAFGVIYCAIFIKETMGISVG